MSGPEVLLRIETGGVAVLTLHRPEARNALNLPTRKLLAEHMARLDEDDAVRVVVICGDAKAFAAGADVSLLAEKSPLEVAALGLETYWRPIERFTKPLIACVEGVAFGAGFELALMCDFIVAAETAKFGLPEVKLGIMPGSGGTQRLLRLIGRQGALRLVLTGEAMPAKRAHELGIVSDLFTAEELWPKTLDLAGAIAALPKLALSHIKEAVREGGDLPLGAALAYERRLFQMLFDSHDQKEGMAAFLQKRPAQFEGR